MKALITDHVWYQSGLTRQFASGEWIRLKSKQGEGALEKRIKKVLLKINHGEKIEARKNAGIRRDQPFPSIEEYLTQKVAQNCKWWET